MKNLIDPAYFNELTEQPPKAVCQRALCSYDDASASYILPVWGGEYAVFPHEQRIDRIGNPRFSHDPYLDLAIVFYLARSTETALFNEWISEKDIPSGAAFFRGPHEIPTHLIASRFAAQPDEFKKTCEQLGGTRLDMADSAYVFSILPRIPLAVLFWDGDDDFPAEAKLLFDRSIADHLALDIIFALAVSSCSIIGSPSDPL